MDVTTQIRRDATSYLTRKGYADLLPMLGLAEDEAVDRRLCPRCGRKLPDPVANGGRKPCRNRACRDA